MGIAVLSNLCAWRVLNRGYHKIQERKKQRYGQSDNSNYNVSYVSVGGLLHLILSNNNYNVIISGYRIVLRKFTYSACKDVFDVASCRNLASFVINNC